MRLAAVLGICGALAAGSANAQAPYYYAKETLSPFIFRAQVRDGVDFLRVGFPVGASVTVRVPQAILDGLAYYARVEMTNMLVDGGSMNMTFARPSGADCGAFASSGSGIGGGSVSFSTMNAAGTVAVYALSAEVDSPVDGCLRFALRDPQERYFVFGNGGHMSLVVKLYDSLAGAILGRDSNYLGASTTGQVAFMHSVITVKVTPLAAATASVERGFAAFAGASPNAASLATVKILATHRASAVNTGGTASGGTVTGGAWRSDPVYRDADTTSGSPMTAYDAATLVGASKVYVKSDRGDFSVGDYYLSGGAGCPAAKLAKVTTGDRAGQLVATLRATGEETVTLTSAGTGASATHTLRRTGDGPGGCTLTLDVAANAALAASNPPGDFKAIAAQKFTADVVIDLLTRPETYVATDLNLSGVAAGEIQRDGTTVQLPYLTVRPGYRQKLVLVNRDTESAAFWVGNVAADGMAPSSRVTAGTPMTVAAGAQKSVPVADLVDLGVGGVEGSATLNVVAAPANVSVATVLTNLATNSTDTLSLGSD